MLLITLVQSQEGGVLSPWQRKVFTAKYGVIASGQFTSLPIDFYVQKFSNKTLATKEPPVLIIMYVRQEFFSIRITF